MSRENITDILCIGCQKGSTSWLHSVLNSHPRTHAFPDSEPVTSTSKEAHFWDWNHKRGIDWYRELMTPADPAKLTMDFTPEYAYLSADNIAECKAINPTAQVIYILRDPMARAVSALRMHMLWRFGKDYTGSLSRDALFFALLRDARVSEHGAYLRNVAAWRRHYPDMMILNYEDFHTDSAASVARIMTTLGLDPSELNGAGQKRFDRLVGGGRVWESEKFPIDRAVLMFLQGLTWPVRQACERELNMRFDEGAQMLSG